MRTENLDLKFLGKYQLKEEIGRGSMGVVYRAYDTDLERDVAIKTISAVEETNESRERFIREAKSIGKLNHNNIITIFDFGNEPKNLYIVMEYLDGKAFNSIIKNKAEIDIKTKLDIIKQLCLGLAYAHKQNVIHRDIKPANIILDKNGTVKILDFGLAIIQASSLTRSGCIGTPNYMAPEILEGNKANEKSDQFSIGLFIYEFLTYSRPFSGDSIPAVLYSIVNSQPRSFDPDFLKNYKELEQIIKKSIEKNPDDRYKSLTILAEKIEKLRLKMVKDNFQYNNPIPLESESAQTLILDTPLIKPALSKFKYKKEIVTVIVLSLISLWIIYNFLKPGISSVKNGTLIFNSKPYSKIIEIIDLKTKKKVNLDQMYTPLNIPLKPSNYKIKFEHLSYKREKTFIINTEENHTINFKYNKQIIEKLEKKFLVLESISSGVIQ